MRQVCQITKHYPIESVLKVDDRRFVTCCGIESFLDTYEISSGWVKREIINTEVPFIHVNNCRDGSYLCQSMDRLMCIDGGNTAKIQIPEGWFVSQTKQTGNCRYTNITSQGKLNVYKLGIDLEIVEQIELRKRGRGNVPITADLYGNIVIPGDNGQLMKIDLELGGCTRIITAPGLVKDLAFLSQKQTFVLANSQISIVDWRVNRFLGRLKVSDNSSFMKVLSEYEIATNIDGNTISIQDLKANKQRILSIPRRFQFSHIKKFEFLKDALIIVDNDMPKIEVYEID